MIAQFFELMKGARMLTKNKGKMTLLVIITTLILLANFSLLILPTSVSSFEVNSNSNFESQDTFGSQDASNFGSPDRFDTPANEQDFSPSSQSQTNGKIYFVHDQLIKIILLLIFTGIAVVLIFKFWHKYRKLLLISSVVVLGFYLEGFLCPLLALQNIFTKWQTGYLPLFLLGLVIPTLFWGKVFCGYVCPFGAIQDLLHIKKIQRKIPFRYARYLGMSKYILLGYLVLRILFTNQVIFQNYTPFKMLFTWGGTPLSLGITVAFALLFLMVYRPFCRYFCPLGAFLGILSHFSFFKIRIKSNCTNCGVCRRVCPTNAIVGNLPKINAAECILCGKCLKKCPQKAISNLNLLNLKSKEEKNAKGKSALRIFNGIK